MLNRNFFIILFFLSGLFGFLFSVWVHHGSIIDIKKPASDIQVIQTFHSPAIFVNQLKGDVHAGEKIFQAFCSACHADKPTIDLIAPRLHDKKTWQIRKKMGELVLLNMTINGVGLMPARGGCFECSDTQLKQAIQYILKEAQHGWLSRSQASR